MQSKFNIILACDDEKRRNTLYGILNREYEVHLPATAADIINYAFSSNTITLVSECFQENKGLEVLGNMKRLKPSVPVIFVAVNGSESLCLNAFRLGAKDYFSEPLNLNELLQCIDTVAALVRKNQRFRTMQALASECECQEPEKERRRGGDRRAYPESGNGPYRRQTADRRQTCIKKTILFIEENYSKDLNLNMLSSFAGMSRSHFSRQFKIITDMTYSQYLTTIRIREAKRLLKNSPFTISEICYAVGFNDLTHFERSFKSLEGLTPSQFRKEIARIHEDEGAHVKPSLKRQKNKPASYTKKRLMTTNHP